MGCAERQGLSGLCKPFMIPSVLIVFVSSELQVGAPVVYRASLTIRFTESVLEVYGCSLRAYTFS